MLRDPWYFAKYVWKLADKAVERIHRPLLYLYTRQAALLVATLDDARFDGEITAAVREDFRRNGIEWNKPAHLPRVRRRLRRVNIRLPRGSGKSTFADIGDTWLITVDPDMTIGLATKADPYAWQRIEAMGQVILSDEYAFWFPERVPDSPRMEVNRQAIWIKGRTVKGVVEASIEGRGANSPWAGHHYRILRRDDIVGAESGDASEEDALRHLAQTDSLRNVTAFEGEVYIGTITGENDDHSVLCDDPGVLSIVVPIERHTGELTVESIMVPGIPTMPEWGSGDDRFDADGISAIKERAKSNPTQGLVWLLQNYYMVANKEGSAGLFSKALVDRAKFVRTHDQDLKRDLIWRPKKGHEATPRGGPFFKHSDWVSLDLKTLPLSAFAWAGDQSVTQDGSGDEWALALVAIDHEGVYYLLSLSAGRGYDEMVSELLPFDKKAGRPPRNGLDSNATQGMTIEWLKRSREFKSLARRVEGVRSNGEAKDIQIRNWIQSRMRVGDFYFDPTLREFERELLRYRPRHADGRKRRNSVDNRLDATWMAMTLPTRPPSPAELHDADMDSAIEAMSNPNKIDPQTGVYTSDWMDCLWSNDAA